MKIKKWANFILLPVVSVSLVAALAGCSSKSSSGSSTQITYTVHKGTVAQQITAVGSVDYSDEHDLSFDASGTLYLSEVDVSAGDSVQKGEILAKLDMTQYQQNITSLQETLASKKVTYSQSEQTVTEDEQKIVTAQNNVTAAQSTLASDQNALTSAQNNLTQTKSQADLTIANDELSVKEDQYAFDTNTGGTYASDKLALAKQQLANDQTSTQADINDAQNKITTAQNTVTSDQTALQTDQDNVTNAQKSLDTDKMSLANAQQAVTDAQNNLDDANATSPEITSPIDGLVISVITAGQEVYKGQTIVTVVDPNKWEVDVSVGESNIPDIQVGGDTMIQFDALSSVTLAGKIASIAPTSTTSQGVVTYAVTVDVVSLTNQAAGTTQGTGQGSTITGTIPSGQMPSGTPPSGAAGQGFTPPAAMTTTTSAAGSSNSSDQVNLRQGMTATVTITYNSANNVLVVPNAAITRTGSTATVKVLVNGVATEKTIQTGLSNSTMTEVKSGLSEGDKVVYYRTSGSSSSSSGSGGGGGLGGLGGGGGPPG